MNKVLVINGNAKGAKDSRTLALTNKFVEEYQKNNPNDQVDIMNLYEEDIRFLDESLLNDIFQGKDTIAKEHALKFAEYDKYVISAPMWNLSFPAIVKGYLDYVMYTGISFKYTESGAVGLLNDKPRKVMHIVSRGGAYGQAPMSNFEYGDSYLRTAFNFMGISNFETVALELTNVLQGTDLDNAIDNANNQAIEAAKQF